MSKQYWVLMIFAQVRWMAWLEGKLLKEERPVGEWAAGQSLNRFRRQEELFALVSSPYL